MTASKQETATHRLAQEPYYQEQEEPEEPEEQEEQVDLNLCQPVSDHHQLKPD